MTQQEFIDSLKHVGYTTQGQHPNHFVVNDSGVQTKIRLLSSCFELRIENGMTLHCYYNKIKVDKVRDSLAVQSINDDEKTGFFMLISKVK